MKLSHDAKVIELFQRVFDFHAATAEATNQQRNHAAAVVDYISSFIENPIG